MRAHLIIACTHTSSSHARTGQPEPLSHSVAHRLHALPVVRVRGCDMGVLCATCRILDRPAGALWILRTSLLWCAIRRYNSNAHHHDESQAVAMKKNLEALLLSHHVDLVRLRVAVCTWVCTWVGGYAPVNTRTRAHARAGVRRVLGGWMCRAQCTSFGTRTHAHALATPCCGDVIMLACAQVVAGHVHAYERVYPVANGKAFSNNPASNSFSSFVSIYMISSFTTTATSILITSSCPSSSGHACRHHLPERGWLG